MFSRKGTYPSVDPNRIVCPFKVGDECHSGFNGDRYPCKVVEVSESGHTVTVQEYEPYNFRDSGPTEGNRDCDFRQATDHEGTPVVSLTKYTLRKDGRYARVKCRFDRLCKGFAYAQNPSV